MYLPDHFKCNDRDHILNLISKNPLATLISSSQKYPFISHLPLVAIRNDSTIRLIGHIAKANKHERLFNTNPNVTAIFHGPNTYITPEWYTENDVPTWNYAVVHCEGTVALLSNFYEIVHCLKKLHEHAQSIYNDKWEFWLPEDLGTEKTLTNAIIGFEITVTNLKAKFKLSKNRSATDKSGIVSGLATRKDDASRGILELMRKASSEPHPNLDDIFKI
jgi:transcriptional regulator